MHGRKLRSIEELGLLQVLVEFGYIGVNAVDRNADLHRRGRNVVRVEAQRAIERAELAKLVGKAKMVDEENDVGVGLVELIHLRRRENRAGEGGGEQQCGETANDHDGLLVQRG